MIDTDQLLHVFVEVADTLVDDFDLIDFLHNVTEHATTISGGSSVGLLLADENDRLHFMAASTQGATVLELFQVQNFQGPCLDCYRSKQPVIIADLSQARDRWPEFVVQAEKANINSVHAFPMRLRNRVIGALNVFGETPLPLDDDDVKVIQAITDLATIAIIQERAITAAETLTQQLQGALNSRVIIEQAKGVVAQSNGVSVSEAFTVLRTYARTRHLRLTDLADDVINGATDPRTLADPNKIGS